MTGLNKTWQGLFAEEEDREAKLLAGQLTLKAAADPQFRQELQIRPKSVIQREAEALSIKPSARVVDAVGRTFSAAVPGADTEKVIQKLIFGTIDDMRKSFNLTLQLSRWLFFAGLLMVVGAFIAALASNKFWAVGVSGGSGALSLLLSAVMNPLDRIRSAAGNLAQVQASYLAFYKQLYILGAATETLSRDDAVSFSQELRKAATAMVETVGTALDKGGGGRDNRHDFQRGAEAPHGGNGGRGRNPDGAGRREAARQHQPLPTAQPDRHPPGPTAKEAEEEVLPSGRGHLTVPHRDDEGSVDPAIFERSDLPPAAVTGTPAAGEDASPEGAGRPQNRRRPRSPAAVNG